MVFCTVEKNLDLSRGVISKNISTAAGTRLQQACRATYAAGIDYGQVVKMPAYDLSSAENIYLGACSSWNPGRPEDSEDVRIMITSLGG